jgi:thiol-disulfide isomerase/thioredoxin
MSRLPRAIAAIVGLVCIACGANVHSPTPASPSLATSPLATTLAVTAPPSSPVAWQVEPLTDARSGTTLRIGDLAGRIVFLEGMATWCPPCLEQQDEARQALLQLDPRKVMYLSVDIDPREKQPTLRAYVEQHGYTWPFVVASSTFLRELSESFGTTVLNPPSTPIVVVDPAGNGTVTEVGIKRADRLVQLARSLGG